jgi:hypothetical protein
MFTRIQLAARKRMAKTFFCAVTKDLKSSMFGKVNIYYKSDHFEAFVRASLDVLRAEDPLNFQRIQNNLVAIVESPMDEFWAGRAIGVYFDCVDYRDRFTREPGRYAALLVRFAIESKIVNAHKIIDVLRNRGVYYDRVVRISVKRELACCGRVGCPMRDVYDLKRLLAELTPAGATPRGSCLDS